VVYVGGGLAYNIKVKEMEPGVDAVMHLEYWKQLPGLVKVTQRTRRAGPASGRPSRFPPAPRSSLRCMPPLSLSPLGPTPPPPPALAQDGCDFSYKHTKAAYVAFQNRNRDPDLSAPIAKAEGGDDDMSRALGS